MATDLGKVTIFFVTQSSASPLLNLAYQAVSDYKNITSSWIDESELAASEQKKEVGTFFVLSSLSGPSYTSLRKLGCRIYGPHIILHYIREGQPLPNWPVPLFSAAMRTSVVSFTSLTADQRHKLTERIRMMHGEVSGDFTVSVNVIVTPKIGSKKYLVGNQVGVPVVLPEWIEESWKISAIQDPFDAMASNFLAKFKVPIFHNLVVCVSGLSAEDREDASQLIEANGGRYSRELKVGECTHLVVDRPVGDKYNYARRWKVQIVTSKWLAESVDKGYAQDESAYKVGEEDSHPQGASTPSEERAAKRARVMPPPDVSVIGMPNATRVAESRILTDESFNVTTGSTSGSSKKSDGPLTGCLVAPLGRMASRREELSRKLVELGGRMCDSSMEALSDDVTHVLVVDPASLKPEHLQFDAGVHVVHLQWLMDCHAKGSRVSESDYAVEVEAETEGEKENESQAKEVDSNSETTANGTVEKSRIDADELAMINQYFEGCDNEEFQTDSTQKIVVDPGSTVMDVDEAHHISGSEPPKTGVFAGMLLHFHESATRSASSDFSQRLRRLLLDTGAAFADSLSPGVDYCVTHFFAGDVPASGPPDQRKPQFVTLAWVYSCLESDRLLDEESDWRSMGLLAYPLNAKGAEDESILKSLLDGCVLCVSGFTGPLRTCLCLYAEALGARMQEGLMRRAIPERGMVASTHLVCAEPSGQKFDAAKRWGIAVVSKEWLFSSAVARRRLPVERFDLTKNKEDSEGASPMDMSIEQDACTPSAKPANNSFLTPTLPAPRRVANLSHRAHEESPRAGVDTPGKFLTEGVQFRPRFDMQSLEEMLKTPKGAERAEPAATPMTEKIHRSLANAVRISKLQSPVGGTAEVAKPMPLSGIVIYVAKKISGKQCELNNLVKQLGGQYKWSYDRAMVTHMIFEGPPTDQQQREELREAKKDKKFVVHPAWVHACHEKTERMSETLYPPDFNPSMSLEITASAANSQASQSQSPSVSMIQSSVLSSKQRQNTNRTNDVSDTKSSEGHFKFEMNMSASAASEFTGNPAPASVNSNDSARSGIGLQHDLQNLSNRTVTNTDSPSCEILNNLDQHLESSASAAGKRRRRRRSDSVQDGSRHSTDAEKKQQNIDIDDQIHPSQSLQVHWRYDDSDGHTLSAGHHQPSLSSSTPSTPSPAPPRPARVLMLSGFLDADRARLADLITKHGQTVLDSRDPAEHTAVTHLVVEKPTRGEKFMTCVAAGKWIVHRSFVESASALSGWPSEERHEWGGVGTEPALVNYSNLERGLARAARRWRVAGGRAFAGWRVVFYSGGRGGASSRMESFVRILGAGGAEVLATAAPYPDPAEVSHAFVEVRKGVTVAADELPGGFAWMKHEFLSAFLIDERQPDKKEYLVADKTRHSSTTAAAAAASTSSAAGRTRGHAVKRGESELLDAEPRVTRASKRLRRK